MDSHWYRIFGARRMTLALPSVAIPPSIRGKSSRGNRRVTILGGGTTGRSGGMEENKE